MDTVEKIWRDISPLYFELHRYVGRKLENEYPSTFNFSQGLIPANLLDAPSLDSWTNLLEIATPYPEIKNSTGTSTEILPNEVFELVNDYMVSMGLYNITHHFGLSLNENQTNYDCEVIPNRLLHSTCNYLQ
ncbi:angiotensin-converting enzyme-like [Agrilus planipennis]|nr:angiotensin-converting enzyme-like [Agrilus planipennis]